MDSATAHRIVAAAVVATVLTVVLAQDWWKQLRDFVSTKTHAPIPDSSSGGGGHIMSK